MAKDVDVLDDLQDQLIEQLTELGFDSESTQIAAHKMKAHFRKHWGGQGIYFGKSKDLTERDTAIFEMYNGRNKEDVLRKFDISEQHFYSIIKKVRSDYIAKKQINLPF